MREADGEFGQCGVFEGYLDGGVPNASFGQMVGGGRGRDSHLEEAPSLVVSGVLHSCWDGRKWERLNCFGVKQRTDAEKGYKYVLCLFFSLAHLSVQAKTGPT